MIITRTPMRISFVGGGTDFPDYFTQHTGAVISTAIDKYIYVTLTEKFDGAISVRYSESELAWATCNLKHRLAKACLEHTGIERGIEMVMISDVPGKGSGLGSSSSLTVGMLNAMYAFKGCSHIERSTLATGAIEVELKKLNSPIGWQDQYAAACGDINKIQFGEATRTFGCRYFNTDVINLRKTANYRKLKWLEESSMLFYLGSGHDSSEILSVHKNNISNKLAVLHQQRDLVDKFEGWLYSYDNDHRVAGELVTKSWELKKEITPQATNYKIDCMISNAMLNGAYGAKVCGAGDGGFLLIICDPINQHFVRAALKHEHELKFNFCRCGSQVIYKNGCS